MISRGSSPLTRGKRTDAIHRHPHQRLIPAHAGKTLSLIVYCVRGRAHPRSRGENLDVLRHGHAAGGSSPLTRGKPHDGQNRGIRRGLIPAHAGKTPTDATTDLASGAHPRSRGENLTPLLIALVIEGSSPLTRGKRTRSSRAGAWTRLIPAHAGKTGRFEAQEPNCAAHPRSRGENAAMSVSDISPYGSSPLTRGKPEQLVHRAGVSRLIPAHAGKTLTIRRGGRSGWAHPRSRGENHRNRGPTQCARGSSPLTRGKLKDQRPARNHIRLIPAHAGKTPVRSNSARKRPAHPRSRGENQAGRRSGRLQLGSSPLTRGKLVG